MSQPSKEFYEQDPRAALLRNICLIAIQADLDLTRGNVEDAEALAILVEANNQLGDLGITPGMHTIEDDDPDHATRHEQLRTSPVLTAEWIAGQVKEGLVADAEITSTTIEAAAPILAEHDLRPDDPRTSLYEMRHAPAKLKEFSRSLTIISAVRMFLDNDAGLSTLD